MQGIVSLCKNKLSGRSFQETSVWVSQLFSNSEDYSTVQICPKINERKKEKRKEKKKQAGAELGQAQFKLSLAMPAT